MGDATIIHYALVNRIVSNRSFPESPSSTT